MATAAVVGGGITGLVAARALLQAGLDVTPVITHRFPMDEYQQAFEVMRAGRSGKVILDWT